MYSKRFLLLVLFSMISSCVPVNGIHEHNNHKKSPPPPTITTTSSSSSSSSSFMSSWIPSMSTARSSTTTTIQSSEASNHKRKKKFSLLRIDPQKIISMICKYGGIILPKTIERDLKILEKTCHCDESYIDLIHCVLELKNLTIALPPEAKRRNEQEQEHGMHKVVMASGNRNRVGDEPDPDSLEDLPAIKVGRICIQWDSYVQPCLSIEVDDVTILIEFVNLLLTRNNWNELQDIGFPPHFYDYDTSNNNDATSSLLSSFITIENIDFSGRAIIKIHSRLLNNKKLINDVHLDLDNLDYLNEKIKQAAGGKEGKGGRKGCSIDEVNKIIQTHFNELIRKLLKFAVTDLASSFNGNDSTTNSGNMNGQSSVMLSSLKDMRKVISGTKSAFVNYAKDVGIKASEDIIAQNLAEIGFSEEQIHKSMHSISSIINERLSDSAREAHTMNKGDNG